MEPIIEYIIFVVWHVLKKHYFDEEITRRMLSESLRQVNELFVSGILNFGTGHMRTKYGEKIHKIVSDGRKINLIVQYCINGQLQHFRNSGSGPSDISLSSDLNRIFAGKRSAPYRNFWKHFCLLATTILLISNIIATCFYQMWTTYLPSRYNLTKKTL